MLQGGIQLGGQLYRSLEVCSEDIYLLGKCCQRHHLPRDLWMDKRTHNGCQWLVHKLQSSHKMAKAVNTAPLRRPVPTLLVAPSSFHQQQISVPCGRAHWVPSLTASQKSSHKCHLQPGCHVRDSRVEAAHALSSESVLKPRAGVMVRGGAMSLQRLLQGPAGSLILMVTCSLQDGLRTREEMDSALSITASQRVCAPTSTV